ncbi:hypothetical protein MRX96_042478 [Rhipicephalus microplus]
MDEQTVGKSCPCISRDSYSNCDERSYGRCGCQVALVSAFPLLSIALTKHLVVCVYLGNAASAGCLGSVFMEHYVEDVSGASLVTAIEVALNLLRLLPSFSYSRGMMKIIPAGQGERHLPKRGPAVGGPLPNQGSQGQAVPDAVLHA